MSCIGWGCVIHPLDGAAEVVRKRRYIIEHWMMLFSLMHIALVFHNLRKEILRSLKVMHTLRQNHCAIIMVETQL